MGGGPGSGGQHGGFWGEERLAHADTMVLSTTRNGCPITSVCIRGTLSAPPAYPQRTPLPPPPLPPPPPLGSHIIEPVGVAPDEVKGIAILVNELVAFAGDEATPLCLCCRWGANNGCWWRRGCVQAAGQRGGQRLNSLERHYWFIYHSTPSPAHLLNPSTPRPCQATAKPLPVGPLS